MKKWLIVLLFAIGLTAATVSIVAASTSGESQPLGGCPNSFHLHMMGGHGQGDHGPHHHVGNDRDFNGDGYICGKHVGANGNVHVHIDNNIPLP